MLTRFEEARITAARALQISMGAPVLIDAGKISRSEEIAGKEFQDGVLPLSVVREYPSGKVETVNAEGEKIGETENESS